MKISNFLLLALISIGLTIGACKDKKDEATTDPQTLEEGLLTPPAGEVAINPTGLTTPEGSTPAATNSNEPHYKCTKAGCTGSGAAQGKCPICSSDLAHNPAFHAQPAAVPGSTPNNPVQINPSGDAEKPAMSTPVAQNSKGEYHYTCSKGHAGAASAGKCSTCGADLVHNPAFHNE